MSFHSDANHRDAKCRPCGLWVLCLGIIGALSVFPSISLAQDAPADRADLELRVQRLVQQLEVGERPQRDEAERQLISLGAGVLPLLPAVGDATAAELRERLIRVRRSLEDASIADVMKPSRITLEGTLSLGEILKQFEQQTGNRVIDFREQFGQQTSGANVSIEFQQMEFWPSLDQTLKQAGMTTYNYTGEARTLGVVARGQNERERGHAACYAGVFRVEATEIQSQRNLRSTSDAALRVRLEVLWEPRLLPVTIRHAYRDLQLTADDGSAIQVAQTEGVAEVPVQSTVAGVDLVMPFALPPRNVQKIASFKGRFTAVLPGREEEFEFGALATAREVSVQKSGLQVTLERARRNGEVHEFRIRLRLLNEEDTFESHLDWAANNIVYLVDRGGNRIDNPNFERYLEKEREIGFAYLFPVAGNIDDYRLIYRSPAAILTVPVDYELKDIELP